jgi:hypothetical protein
MSPETFYMQPSLHQAFNETQNFPVDDRESINRVQETHQDRAEAIPRMFSITLRRTLLSKLSADATIRSKRITSAIGLSGTSQ